MMERLIVFAVVAAAVVYLGWTVWRSSRPGGAKPACPGCPAGSAPGLVSRKGPR